MAELRIYGYQKYGPPVPGCGPIIDVKSDGEDIRAIRADILGIEQIWMFRRGSIDWIWQGRVS